MPESPFLGSLAFLRALASWRSIDTAPGRSPDELRDLQWRRLARLLAHAHARSPHYRGAFARLGIHPGDIRSLDDFERIPPTRRSDLRRPVAFVAEGFDTAKLRSSTTSGSTGEPTTTWFDDEAWFLSKFLLKLRARRACGMRTSDRIALFQEGVADRRPGRFARAHAFTIHRPPRMIVDEVVRYAPTVLYGFPGYLLRLGETAAGRIRPRLVFTSSELLDGQTRQHLEALYGAPVLDVYGSTEVKEIAWQCPLAQAYHVNADWLVLEVIRERGRIGRIVVTPLFNYAMPLLRYELGDTGELIDGRCDCGIGLPLAQPAYGRDVDYFRLPDGEEITPYDLTCAIENVPGMLRYQIVQRAPDAVELRVVPGKEFDDTSREGIRHALRPVLAGVEPDVRLVEALESEPNGKFRVVKSEIAGRAGAPAPVP